MKTFMHSYFRWYYFIIFLMVVCYSRAQSPVWNSSLYITPNPSPYISAWQDDPRILMLTVNYLGKLPVTISFQGVVTGKRFGAIATVKGNTTQMPSGPQTRIYHNTDVLRLEQASFHGKLPAIVRETGRLPEDDYTLCISVLDQNGNQLTQSCATFSISLPAQPELVAPLDKDSLTIPLPTFQWTPVISSAPTIIRYSLRICEVLPGQMPERALSANVPHLEKIMSGAAMFMYPNEALPLEVGKTYAWQIQAIDENDRAAALNEGRSQIRIFTFKKSSAPVYTAAPVAAGAQKITRIHGTLKYHWWTFDNTTLHPLHLIWLKLVYVIEYRPANGGPPVILSENISDISPITTTQTDANGNFTFAFSTSDSIPHCTKVNGMFMYQYLNGDLCKVARVIINSPYYLSPDKNIYFNPGDNIDYSTLIAAPREWRLALDILDPLQPDGYAVPGTVVSLYQKTIPPDIPKDEGNIELDPRPTLQGIGTLVIQDSISLSGSMDLSRIVQNRGSNDEYILIIQSKSQTAFYDPITVKFDGQPNPTWNYSYTDNSIFVSEYRVQYPNTNDKLIPLGWAVINPAYSFTCITGHLVYQFPESQSTKPLNGINTRLVLKYILYPNEGGVIDVSSFINKPDANTTLAYCSPDASGKVLYYLGLSPASVDSMGYEGEASIIRYGGEFPKTYTGSLYRVARIIIDDPYYTSPGSGNPNGGNITITGKQGLQDFGTFTCFVRSYKYQVTVQDFNTKNPISNIIAYLLRYPGSRSADVPQDEGGYSGIQKTKNFNGIDWQIVAIDTTFTDGIAIFTDLVKTNYSNSNDQYYLLLESNPKSLCNYYDVIIKISRYTCNDEQAVYNEDYHYSNYLFAETYNLAPAPPYLQVTYRRSDAPGLAPYGEPVNLLALNSDGTLDGLIYNDIINIYNNGTIKFDNLPPNLNGPDRTLMAGGLGFYLNKIDLLRLDNGQKQTIDEIKLDPSTRISGYVVDEVGNPVEAYVSVDNGTRNHTTCQVRIDVNSGQVSCEKESFNFFAPGGSRRFLVEPEKLDKYFVSDTHIVIQPQYTQDVGALIVYRKLHRIKLQVFKYDPTLKSKKDMVASANPLIGAQIEFLNLPDSLKFVTHEMGIAECMYSSDANNFQIRIRDRRMGITKSRY